MAHNSQLDRHEDLFESGDFPCPSFLPRLRIGRNATYDHSASVAQRGVGVLLH